MAAFKLKPAGHFPAGSAQTRSRSGPAGRALITEPSSGGVVPYPVDPIRSGGSIRPPRVLSRLRFVLDRRDGVPHRRARDVRGVCVRHLLVRHPRRGIPPGEGERPRVDRRLSLRAVVATVLYLSMCYFGLKIMARREAFDPKGFMSCTTGTRRSSTSSRWRSSSRSCVGSGFPPGAGRLVDGPLSFWIFLGIWLHYNKYLGSSTPCSWSPKKSDQLSFQRVPPLPAHLGVVDGVFAIVNDRVDSYWRRA